MAKKKTSKTSNLIDTGPKKLLVFLISFVVIGGGVMAYQTFAGGYNGGAGGNNRTAKMIKKVKDHANNAELGRVQECTQVSGTNNWSEHAWGNAADWSDGEDNVLDYLLKHAEALKVKHIIYKHSQWDIKANGEANKSKYDPDDHEDHLHVSMDPTQGPKKPRWC